MSFLKNRLQRKQPGISEDTKEFVQKTAVQKEVMYGETETDIARKQQLGVVYEVGHDESAELMQEMECFEQVPAYIVDEKGEVVLDEKGKPKLTVTDKLVPHNAAMRIHNSPRNQWRVLRDADIEIASLAMRSAYLKRLASMPRSEYDTGKASLWQAVEVSAKLNLCDSRMGNKLRITNTNRSQIELGQIQKQKEKGAL